MPSLKTKYTFIEIAGPAASQRTRELNQAKVRSHAATEAHQRTRCKGEKEDENGLAEVSTRRGRRRRLEPIVASIQYPVSQSPTLEDGSLDGFSIHIPRTIKIYIDVLVPNLQKLYQIFNVRSIWTEEWLPYMAQKTFYHAVSATFQSIRECLESGRTAVEPSRRVLRHKAKALRILREDLNEHAKATDTSLMAVLFLAIIEVRVGSTDARDLHRTALLELIAKRGGLSEVDAFVRRVLLQFDFFWPTRTRSAYFGPAVALNASPAAGIATPCPLAKDTEQLPSGFQALIKTQRLSIEVVRVLLRINNLLQNSEQTDSHNTKDSSRQEQASGPLYDGFWEACPSLGRLQTDAEPSIDSLLCLGLLLYSSFEFSDLPVWQTATLWTSMIRRSRGDFTEQLMACEKERDAEEEHCLQWLFAVAVGSWRNADHTLAPGGRMLIAFMRGRFPAGKRESGVTKKFFGLDKIQFQENRDWEDVGTSLYQRV